MAMGRRERERQEELFVPTARLAAVEAHPFYRRLNGVLADAGFDAFVEAHCAPFYQAHGPGRPSIAPGVYFRMLFVGYFEGLDSQRGIAWRCNDSLSLREFLGVPLTEQTPDHSTLSRTRGRLSAEVHERVFEFVLSIAATKGLLTPKTVGVDSTTIEADAAMKSIVRRDNGEDYKTFLRRLAAAEGLVDLDDEELRRFDKKRKDKTCSNDEWKSPTDADARIAKLKDGRTHFAYKAEHVVDLESQIIVGVEIYHGDSGDAATLVDSLALAQAHLDRAATISEMPPAETPAEEAAQAAASVGAGPRIEEVVADKGYHKAETLELADDLGYRTYVAEPKRVARLWIDKPAGQQRAVYNNRARINRGKSKALHRLRGERVERSFAHVCDSGGTRRTWLHGLVETAKRYNIATAAHNLAVILRALFGIGKPKALQGKRVADPSAEFGRFWAIWQTAWRFRRAWNTMTLISRSLTILCQFVVVKTWIQPKAT